MLDGVYRLTDNGPVSQAAPSLSAEQLQILPSQIMKRLMKGLTRNPRAVSGKG
jgi:hypothetical protein